MEERYSLRCNELVKKDRDIHTMRNSVPDLAAIANTHFMPKAVLNDNFLKKCEKYVLYNIEMRRYGHHTIRYVSIRRATIWLFSIPYG